MGCKVVNDLVHCAKAKSFDLFMCPIKRLDFVSCFFSRLFSYFFKVFQSLVSLEIRVISAIYKDLHNSPLFYRSLP